MGKITKISYCDSTINPVMGCSGCELYDPKPKYNHCYAASLCRRYAGRKGWPKRFDEPEYFPGRLEKALRWSDLTGKERLDKPWLNGYPRLVFVNDMGDGFAPASPLANAWLEPHIEAMEQSPHIWLFLTKWPKRMMEFFKSYGHVPENFWLGTTVTSQNMMWRAVELVKYKGNSFSFLAWISLEPLLTEVNFRNIVVREYWESADLIKGKPYGRIAPDDVETVKIYSPDWYIIGGESGSNARPMRPDWVRNIRDQCQSANIPFFLKQWGDANPGTGNRSYHRVAGWRNYVERGGRLLDGKRWNELPKV